MPQKKPEEKSTPLSKRVGMAVVGILILMIFFYFFGENLFPMDISYEGLR